MPGIIYHCWWDKTAEGWTAFRLVKGGKKDISKPFRLWAPSGASYQSHWFLYQWQQISGSRSLLKDNMLQGSKQPNKCRRNCITANLLRPPWDQHSITSGAAANISGLNFLNRCCIKVQEFFRDLCDMNHIWMLSTALYCCGTRKKYIHIFYTFINVTIWLISEIFTQRRSLPHLWMLMGLI